MPEIKTINDKHSEAVPSVAEMRASQQKGNEGKGTNDPDCKINDTQGQAAETRE